LGDWPMQPIDLAIEIAAPHPVLAARLEDLATAYHLGPLGLWFRPISEFLWILRLSQAAKGAPQATRGLMALPESLRHIGLDQDQI